MVWWSLGDFLHHRRPPQVVVVRGGAPLPPLQAKSALMAFPIQRIGGSLVNPKLRIPKMAPELGSILAPKLEHFRISQQGQNALIPLCFDSKRLPKGAVFRQNGILNGVKMELQKPARSAGF